MIEILIYQNSRLILSEWLDPGDINLRKEIEDDNSLSPMMKGNGLDLLPESYLEKDKNMLSGLNTPKSAFAKKYDEINSQLETEECLNPSFPENSVDKSPYSEKSIRSRNKSPNAPQENSKRAKKKKYKIPAWWFPITLREILLKIGENKHYYIPGPTEEMRKQRKRKVLEKIEFIK